MDFKQRQLMQKIMEASNKISEESRNVDFGNYMIMGSEAKENFDKALKEGEKHRTRKLKMKKLLKELNNE